jgi:hypothetical protein
MWRGLFYGVPILGRGAPHRPRFGSAVSWHRWREKSQESGLRRSVSRLEEGNSRTWALFRGPLEGGRRRPHAGQSWSRTGGGSYHASQCGPNHCVRGRNYEADLSPVRVPLDDALGPVGVQRVEGQVTGIDLVRSRNSCGVVVIPQQPAEPLPTAHRTSGLVLSDFPGWKQQSVAFPRRAKNSAEIERGVLWPVELKENKWIRLLASFGNDFRHDSRRRHRS